MKKIATIMTVLLFGTISFSQNYTVNGMVKDAKTNNPIIGAAVFELGDVTIGTATDTEGFFSLNFEKSHIFMKVAYIGYKDTVFDIHLKNDTALIVNLISETDISEVEIEDDSINWKPQTDTLSGNYKKVYAENYDTEPEIKAKNIIIPKRKKKVKPDIDELYFSSNNNCCGKIIYIDEARIYSSQQFLKIIPFINANSIGDYQYYNANYPAEYGDLLAPIIDLKMKEGDKETYLGTLDFNFFATGISAQGPVKEERSSFFISARKSYLNNFYTDLFRKDNSGKEQYWSQPSFWDLNLKYTHNLTEKSKFTASFFHNYNRLNSGVNEDIVDSVNYGIHRDINSSFSNTALSLNFKHQFSQFFFLKTALVFSNFSSKNTFTGDSVGISGGASSYINRYNAEYLSKNNNIALKLKAAYNLNDEHYFIFGTNAENYHFKAVEASLILNDFEHPFNLDTSWQADAVNTQKYSVFIQDKYLINEELTIKGGLYFSAFINSGKSYLSLEPRIFANYKLFNFLSLNIAYSYHKEYLHILSGHYVGLSSDIFIPSSKNVLPEITNHFAAGAKINLPFDIKLKGNIFYDNISNLYEYKDFYSFFDYPDKIILTGMNIEERITPVKGNYTGIRVTLSKEYKGFSVNIGNTISDFSLKSDSINFRQTYQYGNNYRNDFNFKLSYKINENINVFAEWNYRSGNYVTLHKQHYIPYEYNNGRLGTGNLPDASTMYLTDYIQTPPFGRNDFKLPTYNRLDIGLTYTHYNHTFGIRIYNVYNRKNADLTDYKKSVISNAALNQIVNYTNLPFLPTLSYSYRFDY